MVNATRGRRGNGEGSIYPHRDGFQARVWVHDPAGGTRRRATFTAASYDAVAAMVRDAVTASDAGQAAVPSKASFAAYAADWSETTLAVKEVEPSTRRLYRHAITSYLNPTIGEVPLARLTAGHIEKVDLGLRHRQSSDATRRLAYNVARMVLDTAVRDGLLRANPTHQVARPVEKRRPQPHYNPRQLQRLFRASADHRILANLVPFMAYTAVRPGEALALRWADVDLEAGIVTVGATLTVDEDGRVYRSEWTKGGKAPRLVPLVPSARTALRAARVEQTRRRLEAGSAWEATGLVFTDEAGRLLDDRTLRNPYRRVVAAADLEGSFHALRRSAGTALTAARVPLPVVSMILGHASTRITAEHYTFVDVEMMAEAMTAMEDRMSS